MQSLMRKLVIGVSAPALLVGASQIVAAQDSEDEGAIELQEIVVTAQKREQLLKDVQLAVKAIDGA